MSTELAADRSGVAYFPTPYSPELAATLTIDGVTDELIAIDPSELDGAVYRCLPR